MQVCGVGRGEEGKRLGTAEYGRRTVSNSDSGSNSSSDYGSRQPVSCVSIRKGTSRSTAAGIPVAVAVLT